MSKHDYTERCKTHIRTSYAVDSVEVYVSKLTVNENIHAHHMNIHEYVLTLNGQISVFNTNRSVDQVRWTASISKDIYSLGLKYRKLPVEDFGCVCVFSFLEQTPKKARRRRNGLSAVVNCK